MWIRREESALVPLPDGYKQVCARGIFVAYDFEVRCE
jgi:hypothetical protein